MQNDLISRKDLIEAIVNKTGSPTVLFNTTEELNAYLEGCAFKQNDIIDMINDLPTAYNVEKVVAELEQQRDLARLNFMGYTMSNWDRAIEIVRNGGKE